MNISNSYTLSKMTKTTLPKHFKFIKSVGPITEYRHKSNDLTVLHAHYPGTGVVTTNITYLVGSRDEVTGETGLAHMLEHMLFKPTKSDVKQRLDSGAMRFEREVGVILNANTWKDRTTYFFSMSKDDLDRALAIEADRMHNVVLTDKEFLPERSNVLSEFDMYNGRPDFALGVAMTGAAFQSHPYKHETIGFREDIAAYTIKQVQNFYDRYYRPNNAVLMVFGDVSTNEALEAVDRHFAHLAPGEPIERHEATEPKQEGLRRVEVVRPGTVNLLSFGLRHAGFPSLSWLETYALGTILTDGGDAILNKALVDTGLATTIDFGIEPLRDPNLATLNITLAGHHTHEEIEKKVLDIIARIEVNTLNKKLKGLLPRLKKQEAFERSSSLGLAMDLTEYVATGDWTSYDKHHQLIQSLTGKRLNDRLNEAFKIQNLTIGYYRSI